MLYKYLGLIGILLIAGTIITTVYRILKKKVKVRKDVVIAFILGSILVIASFIESPNFHARDNMEQERTGPIQNPFQRKDIKPEANEKKEEKPKETSEEREPYRKSDVYTDEDIEVILENHISYLDPKRDDFMDYDEYVMLDGYPDIMMNEDNIRHLVKGKYVIEEIGRLEPEEINPKYRDLIPNPYYILTTPSNANQVQLSMYGNMFSVGDKIPKPGDVVEFKVFVLEKMTSVTPESSRYIIICLGGFR